MRDDDRPRKSWRDIDKSKDRSQHRRDERPLDYGKKNKGPLSNKSYRAALDRLFDSGRIADLVEQQAPGGKSAPEESSENRIRLLQAIINANSREELCAAADQYLEKYPLPEDPDALGKIVEHRDPAKQRLAMEKLLTVLDQAKPKRARAIVGQLKMIRDTNDDPELVDLARQLLDRLE